MEIRTILVGVDFSEPSEAAFEVALAWAREFGARLRLLHAYELPRPGVAEYRVDIPDTLWERVRSGALQAVNALRERAVARGVEASAEVCEGPAAEALARAAEQEADLLVVGTHGHRGVERLWLGSVAERTARTAPCSVLAARCVEGRGPGTPGRILAATDFSEAAQGAVEVAADLARRLRVPLDLVHAFGLPAVAASPYDVVLTGAILDEARASAERLLGEAAARLSSSGVDVEQHLAHTPAAEALAAAAGELGADLVVMATHGHTGLKHALLGSVAERTLRIAPCSVLIVKGA